MKINAQIKAITSLMEFLSNVALIIHVVFTKSTTFSTMIHGMTLYCVVLPNVSLLSSSENKIRLIEQGWMKTIMESLRIPNYFVGGRNNVKNIKLGQVSDLEPNDSVQRIDMKKLKDNKVVIIRVDKNEEQNNSEQLEFLSILQNPSSDPK